MDIRHILDRVKEKAIEMQLREGVKFGNFAAIHSWMVYSPLTIRHGKLFKSGKRMQDLDEFVVEALLGGCREMENPYVMNLRQQQCEVIGRVQRCIQRQC